MNKGLMLINLMIYLLISTLLCGMVLRSVHYMLNAYQRLNNQASLVRSMIVGCALLNTLCIHEPWLDNNNLYWKHQNITHALVLNNKIIWHIIYKSLGLIKQKIALMEYVDHLSVEQTAQGLSYFIELKLQDQRLAMQVFL